MATPAQIRSGLVANLSPLGIQSTGYMLSSPISPSIECFPGETTYDLTYNRGVDMVTWTVRITVATAIDIAAQQTLDRYLEPSGSQSVKTLLEADSTLGGAVGTLHVTRNTGFQAGDIAGTRYLSCDWFVDIYH